ncbi:MAG: M48 family metalloprotease [Porticoccus sp.]|nr:M48 family metalloprotease [Porticoccus sp.]
MKQMLRLSVAIIALSSILTGCSVNPVTGETEFSLVSAEQEVAIGTNNYGPSQQSQGGRYYIDPNLQVYIRDIGKKLAAVSDRPNLPYEFVVLNNSTPNAWALPGGKIAVNRGLLLHLDDEAELAAVLGHEIVHAAARHGASQSTRGTIVGLGAAAVSMLGSNYGLGDVGSQAAQMGAAAWMAKYGRNDELEADAYGMDYLARAGYDPAGGVRVQEAFVKLSQGQQEDFLSNLFASHPPSQERVDANRVKAASLPKGPNYRDRYQRAIAQLKRDKPAYDAEVEAIKALNAKNHKAALVQLDKAIKIQPNEGSFWELRGHAWEMSKNPTNADKAFTTAIGKNPDLFSPYLYRGISRYEQGKKTSAKTDLERSYKLLPTPPASYFLGEIALESGDKQSAIQYFQTAAQGNNEIAKRAAARLAVLELATSPHKYILSKISLGDDGYMRITVKNNSPVTVNNVELQLSEMANSFMVGNSSSLKGPSTLAPGKQVTMNTRIGPFSEAAEMAQYRIKVSKVQVPE